VATLDELLYWYSFGNLKTSKKNVLITKTAWDEHDQTLSFFRLHDSVGRAAPATEAEAAGIVAASVVVLAVLHHVPSSPPAIAHSVVVLAEAACAAHSFGFAKMTCDVYPKTST